MSTEAPPTPVSRARRTEKALDYALDCTKHMVFIAASIITVTVAMHEKFGGQRGWLVAAWVCFLLSIAAGLLTELALVGQWSPTGKNSPPEPSVYASPVIATWYAQVVLWFVGLVLVVIYGIALA